jgi:hypothetical protein
MTGEDDEAETELLREEEAPAADAVAETEEACDKKCQKAAKKAAKEAEEVCLLSNELSCLNIDTICPCIIYRLNLCILVFNPTIISFLFRPLRKWPKQRA